MSGKAVRETLAALGVIASMVFVGMEIRQNTSATRGQTRQALAESSQQWLMLRSTDAEFDDIFYKAWESPGELTASESRRAVGFGLRFRLRRHVIPSELIRLRPETVLECYQQVNQMQMREALEDRRRA